MGNIGQHYYRWRYGTMPPKASPTTMQTPSASNMSTPDFTPFAEAWSRHGFGLTVDARGRGSATWRIYSFCSDDPTPPCDMIVGNEIMSGGKAIVTFTSASPSTAAGTVTGSTDTGTLTNGPLTFAVTPEYDMATLTQGESILTLCGPHFADKAPPQIVKSFPCGA